MRIERLRTIEYIPIKNFKEKIKLTKKNYGKGKMQMIDKHLYIERCRYE